MQSSIAPEEQVMYEYCASGVNNVLNISVSLFMTVIETLLCGFEARLCRDQMVVSVTRLSLFLVFVREEI